MHVACFVRYFSATSVFILPLYVRAWAHVQSPALLCQTICIFPCVSVRLHDTSHHSPWLCAPPSPSSVSVRLLSILAPQRRSSSGAERCHQSTSRRLSLRPPTVLHTLRNRGKGAQKICQPDPPRSSLPVGCAQRGSRRERGIFFPLCRSSS